MNNFATDLAATLAPRPEPGAEARVKKAVKLVTEQMLADPTAWVTRVQDESDEELKRLQLIIAGGLRLADAVGEFSMPSEARAFLEGAQHE